MLEDIHTGEIQLPDFQRGWVWDDDHISSLIASISLAYPVGAVMLLETGGDGVRLKPRPIEGVILENGKEPEKLILDGQQRLTSLYLSLKSGKPVPTKTEKSQKIDRLYYIDMKKALDPETDRIEAIVSLPPEKIITRDFGREVVLDVSTQEKEYEHYLFPLSLVFDTPEYMNGQMGFNQYHKFLEEPSRFLMNFNQEIWMKFQQYKVPVIELLRGTPKEAVCQVFEKVNTGGVSLSVFELMTATFAADDYNLREDWKARASRLKQIPPDYNPVQTIDSTAFLTAVTLLSSYHRHISSGNAVSCKRKDVLKLSLDDFRKYADKIEGGLKAAARLLVREKIFDIRNLPYSTQLIPLAAICALLGDRFESDPVKQKLARWYWCGVFGELYGGANETRFAFDVPEVIRWVDGGEEPRTVRDASFNPTRLLSLQSRLSAAYKGLMALLMQNGGKDFLNGDPIELTTYFDLAIDIHHIFPRVYCEKQDYKHQKWNSVINKAPLSARTNRIIGGRAPSVYLESLEKNHNVDTGRLDQIIESHLASPGLLRSDNFDEFIRERAIKLLDLIQTATGKSITGRDSEEVVHEFGYSLEMPS
ncbi:MAG: DUF262 domain-containing protein [Desulfobulbaceae bacterium]|nr:DUF262 domain-containing protein [Desulfobulbaceae bacterium]